MALYSPTPAEKVRLAPVLLPSSPWAALFAGWLSMVKMCIIS